MNYNNDKDELPGIIFGLLLAGIVIAVSLGVELFKLWAIWKVATGV